MEEADLAVFNERALRMLPRHPPRDHLQRFYSAAMLYLEMVGAEPNKPCYTYKESIWAAIDSLGVLAVEWHVHAWDLAAATKAIYSPVEPATLARAFHRGMPYLRPPTDSSWIAVLSACGRTPA
jgi:hypothetical protein